MCVREYLWLNATRGHADPHYGDLGKGGERIGAAQADKSIPKVFHMVRSLSKLYALTVILPKVSSNQNQTSKKMSQSSEHGQSNISSSSTNGSRSNGSSSTGAQGWQPVTTETNSPSGWQQGSGGGSSGWQQGSGSGLSGWQPGAGGGSSGWQQSSSGGGMSAGRQQGVGRGSR